MKKDHYHYLVVLQGTISIANTHFKCKEKLSMKDIALIQENRSKARKEKLIIVGFFPLECDCDESN